MKILPRAEYRSIPWKNGRGIAHQIAAFPAGAGYDAFDWQVSRPEIAANGPFSSFPRLDRHFMLLSGSGLTLKIRSESESVAIDHSIDVPLEPFAFRGEWDVECVLKNGPVQVFNVMTRRGRAGARLEIVDLGAAGPVAKPAGETLLVYVAHGAVDAWGRWGKATLAPDDSILVDDTGAAEIAIAPASGHTARLALVRLHTERA